MYFITAVTLNWGGLKHSKRCFGYTEQKQEATLAVKENRGNMHECLYQYLVIERIDAGIHPVCDEEHWYRWSGSKWTPTRKPSQFRGIINWAIG